MGSLERALLALLSFAALTPCAIGGEQKPTASIAAPAAEHGSLTGKERLGPKWTHEQRIDNCKVPLDKRGTKPRPSGCADAPPS
jgi:hypothetical protein